MASWVSRFRHLIIGCRLCVWVRLPQVTVLRTCPNMPLVVEADVQPQLLLTYAFNKINQYFTEPMKGHGTFLPQIFILFLQISNCSSELAKSFQEDVIHYHRILSCGNEILSCGNEILSCGNEILSGYHKIVIPCCCFFHSFPSLTYSLTPLTNSSPPLTNLLPLTNSLPRRTYSFPSLTNSLP